MPRFYLSREEAAEALRRKLEWAAQRKMEAVDVDVNLLGFCLGFIDGAIATTALQGDPIDRLADAVRDVFRRNGPC